MFIGAQIYCVVSTINLLFLPVRIIILLACLPSKFTTPPSIWQFCCLTARLCDGSSNSFYSEHLQDCSKTTVINVPHISPSSVVDVYVDIPGCLTFHYYPHLRRQYHLLAWTLSRRQSQSLDPFRLQPFCSLSSLMTVDSWFLPILHVRQRGFLLFVAPNGAPGSWDCRTLTGCFTKVDVAERVGTYCIIYGLYEKGCW